ncbi:MAG: response regulator [Nitrospinae bacterium]|nr:response regulator [Nitrospinota bacterium]
MEKLKVLIAEDEPLMHNLFRLGLNPELYDLKFAVNGKEAFEEWERWHPDVVMLDIMMPVMSGYVVLKDIRRIEEGSGHSTPVIVTTALGGKGDVMDCVKLGVQGYLVKPINYNELAQKIESCVNRV